MNSKQLRSEDLDRILKTLSNDSVLRAAVIRAIARDFPKEFLAPVKINSEALNISNLPISSDKEWQE
jgi:hypothetical protein